ncbi:MAG: lyase, partial [Pseudomonadota bacterium]
MRTTVLLTLASIFPTIANAELDIKEWEVPYEQSRPRDPFATSAESVWFVGQRTGYLARLDTESGEFKQIELKDGSGPHNLIVASNGDVWFAGNRTALIGRYDPSDGSIEEVPMPDPKARDPHTLIFDADESHIWF